MDADPKGCSQGSEVKRQCTVSVWEQGGDDSSSQPTPLKHDVDSAWLWDCLTVSVNSGPVWKSGVHLGAHRVHHTLIFIIVSEGPWPWKLVTVTKCNSWKGGKGETESRYTFKDWKKTVKAFTLSKKEKRQILFEVLLMFYWKAFTLLKKRKDKFFLKFFHCSLAFFLFLFLKDFTFIPFLIIFTVFSPVHSHHSWLVTTL